MSDDKPRPGELLGLEITDEDTGRTWHISFDLAMSAAWLSIIRARGIDYAQDLALTGIHMAGGQVTEDQKEILRTSLQAFAEAIADFEDQEDLVLAISYDRLRDKKMTRAQAADDASIILGRPISTEAWRKAVDRWAERNSLPKVEIHRRSKVKTDN